MILRALVADDEPLARERMRMLLADDPEVEIVAEAGDADEVLDALARHKVDLLFLDIEMPQGGGFEIFPKVDPDRLPMVIFVTAFNEHAVRAFEVHALDYLLKPVDPERLSAALQRAKRQRQTPYGQIDLASLAEAVRAISAPPAPPLPDRLLIHNRRKDVLLEISRIEWIEAENYYSRLHLADASYLMRESIRNLETKLDSSRFVRVHRSAIVNIARVREIHRDGGRDASLLMTSGRRIRISKPGGDKLLEALTGSGGNTGVILLQS